MGRYPLLLLLILQVTIILVADFTGARRPQQPPGFGYDRYGATVLSTREAATSGQLLIAEIDSVGARRVEPFLARIHYVSEIPTICPGQRIAFNAKTRALPDVPDVPDIIDLQKSLRRRGVVASVVVAPDSLLYVASSRLAQTWFARANNTLLDRLRRAPLAPQTIDILAAILLGRSEALPASTRADYSAAGLSHVLALSGMHVGVIAIIIACALWPFYLGRHVRTRLLLTIISLWLYAALTGFIPSVTRAVIMASVYMTGRILQRKSSSINSLCLAAILILLLSPEELYAPGFQLSFAAVLGIILFYPLINRVDRREHPITYNLVSYPALSVSAMTMAGIVSAFHFHSFPIYFLISNLVIVPVIPLLLISGVASIALEANCGADALCRIMDTVANGIAALPGSAIDGLYPSAWIVILLLAALILVAAGAHNKRRFLAIEGAMLFIGTLLCCAVYPRTRYPKKEVYQIVESKSTQTIIATDGECTVLTTARLPSERREIEQRYRLLLRDFVTKRRLKEPTVK